MNAGELSQDPQDWVIHKITQVLEDYPLSLLPRRCADMPNILMTRIDNRLVHGQVGVTWTNYAGRQSGGGGQR
ncbi:PTS system N-acetylgalactosamine-specific transporter subunit IIB [Serratia fonticola]|uniref:PTS system N-acetylgalactosamine-specific transporter subunit IIB n=1 Tax=Serratia fonticola TaxID=47917 RepID=A0A4U9V238_SERFO|nr:PTS system N-acetylgalactosamine-specific transporter subunit IIB [Serratia fonticola]